ncbi:hypothetical protein [Streptomyces sp. NPDC051310]|uniref:hypothetical protein n=1 Tax=Streptomyces sp. NPDC051310 TaxID=3365649 RepID=UPI0037B685A4
MSPRGELRAGELRDQVPRLGDELFVTLRVTFPTRSATSVMMTTAPARARPGPATTA